ncbi:MAG: hypothetical protein QXN67_04190 [Thermoproteota archaeon]
MVKITMASTSCPVAREINVAAIRIIIRMFLNLLRKIFKGEAFSPASSLGSYF